jgi:hypothetical protein
MAGSSNGIVYNVNSSVDNWNASAIVEGAFTLD